MTADPRSYPAFSQLSNLRSLSISHDIGSADLNFGWLSVLTSLTAFSISGPIRGEGKDRRIEFGLHFKDRRIELGFEVALGERLQSLCLERTFLLGKSHVLKPFRALTKLEIAQSIPIGTLRFGGVSEVLNCPNLQYLDVFELLDIEESLSECQRLRTCIGNYD